MPHINKKSRITLAAFLLTIIAFAAWWFWPGLTNSSAKSAAGFYLTDGGRALIVIKFDPHKGLYVPEEYLKYTPLRADAKFQQSSRLISAADVQVNTIVEYASGQLHFAQRLKLSSNAVTSKYMGVKTYTTNYSCLLTPSYKRPGDWDLSDGELAIEALPLDPDYNNFYSANRGDGSEIQPKTKIIPSYLIKIGDPRIVDFFAGFENESRGAADLQLMRGIERFVPDNPILQLYELELEALAENPELAVAHWQEWRKKFAGWKGHPVWTASYFVLNTINHQRAARAGYDFQANFELMSAQEQTEWLAKLSNYDYTITGREKFVEIKDLLGGINTPPPYFLDFQAITKTICTWAILDLLLGKPADSAKKLLGIYRVGQNLNAEKLLLGKLIGMLVRRNAIRGLEIYALNADVNFAELSEFQKQLESLNQVSGQEDGGTIEYSELKLLTHGLRQRGNETANWEEFYTRQFVADVKFQLLRVATAVRVRLLASGDFPTITHPTLPSLLGGMPNDHFFTTHLRLLSPSTKNVCVIYSIGPDKFDNHAAIVYDPTNGTISGGDIIVRIPREREFLFPRNGVKARNAYELLTQFPNGLPADGYASTQMRPLSIIESTSASPLIIFSYGPDRDESLSAHDQALPILTHVPPLPENASRGRRLQNVFLPGKINREGQANSTLEPYYDPTNGTASEGDLFIELPAEHK